MKKVELEKKLQEANQYIEELQETNVKLDHDLNDEIVDLVRQNEDLGAYQDKFYDLAGSIETAIDMIEGRELQYGGFNVLDILIDNDLKDVA